MSEIKISYEYIFDVRMREKKKQEIQKIDNDFYAQVTDFLNELRQRLVAPTQTKLERDFEQERLNTQINNIRRLVREIFEIRERKIIKLALNKSKIKNAVIDTGNFLSFEVELMQKLSHTISEYQNKYLFKIMTGNKVYSKPMNPEEKLEVYDNRENDASKVNGNNNNPNSQNNQNNSANKTNKSTDANNINSNKPKLETKVSATKPKEERKIRIRLLKPLPKLIAGPNKDVIGPYKTGEMVHMGEKIALKLVEKGRAERVD